MDTLLGLAITGVFLATFLGSVSAGFIGLKTSQDVAMAESLVRSQLESIKGQSYLSAGGYSTVASPPGYSIAVDIEPVLGADPAALQQIVVSIYRGSKSIKVVSSIKVSR